MTTHADGREYDIIFAGGGTAACAAAGRLARNNPDVSILIIESGKNNLNETAVVTPAMFASHLLPDSQTCQFYQSNAEEALNGRQSFVPVGKTLGGGSSVNLLCYTRAQAVDFDSWKAKGWDFQSLLPYIRRLETYHPEDTTGDKALHGRDGPVHVTFGTGIPDGPADDVLQAAAAIGIPTVPDLQDFTSCSAVSRWPKYISTEGKRQDAAHCYIHPLMQSGKAPNLHLLLESRVTKVIFNDQKHACGVEYITGTSNQVRTINARKLVVVSAGALSTPSILERSGIGSQKLLKDLNIPLTSDLPDVGEHYQDHHMMMNPYKTSLTAEETLDCLFSGRKDFAAAIAANEPIIGRNGIDVHLKLRPSPDAVKALGTDFEELWTRDFADQPTRPLLLVGIVSTFLGDHRMVDKEGIIQYTTIGTWTSYPYSRGSIHIQSADASTPASFNTGFLSHPADVKMQIWAYKTQRELFRRTNAYRGELAIGHPKFPEGSKAALRDGAAATFASASDREQLADLEYTKEDEAAIEDHVRNNVASTWHSLGTCRMAPREQGGVVDEELNVYGVTGLKCCDLSICPSNVGANTNHTALLIGEKAADIIAKDLGLKIT